jgi:mannose-6-phosphate isomerase-like protein (cupin superfamily)
MIMEWGQTEALGKVDQAVLLHTTVKAGESITGRNYDTSTLFYVVNGAAQCELELGFIKKKSVLAPKNTIYIPAGVTFKITNSGPTKLTLIEIEQDV